MRLDRSLVREDEVRRLIAIMHDALIRDTNPTTTADEMLSAVLSFAMNAAQVAVESSPRPDLVRQQLRGILTRVLLHIEPPQGRPC